MIYHLVGHEILNKTLYFVKRYYSQILRYVRKCMKKFNIIIEWIKMLLHKLRHEYVKRIQNCNALYSYIMIVIWMLHDSFGIMQCMRRSIAARRWACFWSFWKHQISHYQLLPDVFKSDEYLLCYPSGISWIQKRNVQCAFVNLFGL